MMRLIIASLLIACATAAYSGYTCSTDGCNCCCHGDTSMPLMGQGSGSMSGYVCKMGQSVDMCCAMNVNSIEIEFDANIEDEVANGNIDGNQLAGDIVAFLVDNGVPVEDIIDVQFDGTSVIVVISEDNDPDAVMALQSTLNNNIGNFVSDATDATASAGTTSFNPVSTGTDAQGKQVTLLEFCVESKKGKKEKKGKSMKKSKGKKDRQRRKGNKKGVEDEEDEEEQMEGRMFSGSGSSMEGRTESGSMEGRDSEDCIPLPNTGKGGKKNKKSKKAKKNALTSFLKSGSAGMKVTAAMFIGIGCAVLAVAVRRYKQSVANRNEITEESPLLDVENTV